MYICPLQSPLGVKVLSLASVKCLCCKYAMSGSPRPFLLWSDRGMWLPGLGRAAKAVEITEGPMAEKGKGKVWAGETAVRSIPCTVVRAGA